MNPATQGRGSDLQSHRAGSSLNVEISDQEFELFRDLLHHAAGIYYEHDKKMLFVSRLGRRLRLFGLDSFRAYFDLLMDKGHAAERQVVVDLLTTNETYFFREPGHFRFLTENVLDPWSGGQPCRIWSAASSSGEEAYSIAMTLEDHPRVPRWEVVGSDISTRVLKKARHGHYSMARSEGIPREFLKRYCLKGTGPHAGTLLISRALRERVSFMQVNLNESLPEMGMFDVIFLRNILIYFDREKRIEMVQRMLPRLKSGGHFLIGHSETLKDLDLPLDPAAPTVYRKR